MTTLSSRVRTKVADEVWVAAALLHHKHPERADFAIDEIMQCAAQEAYGEPLRPGVYVHIVQHSVANRPPNPGRYRMLYETAPGRRRLFRKGDSYHPAREGAKITPEIEDVPSEHNDLIAWYRNWSATTPGKTGASDPLRIMREISKGLWAEENPDDYVRGLREGWE